MTDWVSSDRPGLEPIIIEQPHEHHWQPVGIVYLLDETDEQVPAVAQSCECGAVQAVAIAGALR